MASPDHLQTFTLETETSHLPHLGSGLNRLRNEDIFCDVTIEVDNKSFRAHKAVLTAGSDYFRAMFRGGFQEQDLSDVAILGESDIFECILDFIYTGKLEALKSRILDVITLANYLQVPHAISAGANHLTKRLNESHQELIPFNEVADIWFIAKDIQHTVLTDTVNSYVTSHFSTFCKMEEFLEHMPLDLFSVQLEKGEELAASANEEEIFLSVVKWLKYDWTQRKDHSYALLSKIRLGIVPIDTLRTWLDTDIESIPACNTLRKEVLELYSTKETSRTPLYYSHPDLFTTRSTYSVLIALGGETDKEDFVEYFDDKSGRWKNLSKWCPLPLMNVTLCLPSIVEANGDLYLAGGKICTDDDYVYNSTNIFRYNVGGNTWTALAAMNIEREPTCGIVHLDNYIYALGGNERLPGEIFSTPIQSAERYNMEIDEWETLSDMPSKCFNPSVVVYNDNILVYGPQKMEPHMGEPSLYTLMMFCPQSLSWISLWSNQRSSGMIPSTLTVHQGMCYEIRHIDDGGHRGQHKPQVRLLTLDLDGDTPSVEFEEPEEQELISNYHEFCISGRLFVIMSLENYVHDTGVLLTVDNAHSDQHRCWSRAKDIGSLDKCVISLQIDKLMLE